MATYEKNGLLTYVDGDGNEYKLFPKTKIECVDGLGDKVAKIKKTYFTIPAGQAASIAFRNTTSALIYCRGWGSSASALFYYSGYGAGKVRQGLVTLENGGKVSCGLNYESSGQGMTIKNNNDTVNLEVCIDSAFQDYEATITFTENNASELYTEFPDPPMEPNVEYRTTERYKSNPVYKKVDGNGNILWRAGNESTWHLLASAESIATATVE